MGITRPGIAPVPGPPSGARDRRRATAARPQATVANADGDAMSRIALSMVTVALLVSAAHGVHAQEVYQYTDGAGRTHFTDSYGSIPERYRERAVLLDPSREGARSVVIVPSQSGAERDGEQAAQRAEAARGENVLSAFRRGAGAGLSTGALLLFMLGGLTVGLCLCAAILKLACHMANEESIAFGKAVLVSIVMGLANAAVSLPMQVVGGTTVATGAPLLWLVMALVGGIGASALVLRGMHCETAGGAVKVTLFYTFIPVVLGIFLLLLHVALRAALG
jgi:hypothetical protein